MNPGNIKTRESGSWQQRPVGKRNNALGTWDGSSTPSFRDPGEVVYSTDGGTSWLPLEGATIQDGTSVRVGLIVDFLGSGDRNTPLSEYQSSGFSGSVVHWYNGIAGAGGTLFTYGSGPNNRDDDYQTPYDAIPGGTVNTSALGGPGTRYVTARCVYPSDGQQDDHIATFTVATPALVIESGPFASTSATSALISITTSTSVDSMTVEYRQVGSGTWTAAVVSEQYSQNPSVNLTALTDSTDYEYRIPTGGVTDIYAQTVDDTTVRTFSTTPVGGGGGGSSTTNNDISIPSGFPDSTTTGLPNGWTPTNGTVTNLSSSSNGQIIEDMLITGAVSVSHDNVTIRNCRIKGENSSNAVRFIGGNGLIEDCEIGLDANHATLMAPVSQGGNQITLDVDLPFGSSGEFLSGHSYVMMSLESKGKEQYRTIGKVDNGNGTWTYTMQQQSGDPGTTSAASFKFNHQSGHTVSYWRHGVDAGIAGNGVSAHPSGKNYTARRLDIHHCNDGVKLGHSGGFTLVEDCYIHEQIYVAGAHLDGAQGHSTGDGKILHCTIDVNLESTSAVKYGDSFSTGQVKYCYLNGGRYGTMRWGANSGGNLKHNRFGRSTELPFNITESINVCRDNLYAESGILADGTGVTAGGEITELAQGGLQITGDRDGDGTGSASVWDNAHASDTDWSASYGQPGV